MLLSKQVSTDARPFLIQWLILGLGILALGGAIGYSITHEHKSIDALERERLTAQAKVVDANLEQQLVALNMALTGIRNDLYDDAVADACLRLFREKGFKLEGT